MIEKVWRDGGCHCGNVRFKVLDDFSKVTQCDCSICNKKGFLHIIVSKDHFKLETDSSNLESYQFNTKTANHLFCKNCGISSYYIPRSHPNGYSINARCIDDLDLSQVEFIDFQGSEWEKNINNLNKKM